MARKLHDHHPICFAQSGPECYCWLLDQQDDAQAAAIAEAEHEERRRSVERVNKLGSGVWTMPVDIVKASVHRAILGDEHDDKCCRICDTHSDPHRGCILR